MEKSRCPIPRSCPFLASASTIQWLIHQKFELGIPLYCAEKEGSPGALSLSSKVELALWRLPGLVSLVAARPAGASETGYLHIDETPRTSAEGTGRKNTSDSYMWYTAHQDAKAGPDLSTTGERREISGSIFKGLYRIYHTKLIPGTHGVKGVNKSLCYTPSARAFGTRCQETLHGRSLKACGSGVV